MFLESQPADCSVLNDCHGNARCVPQETGYGCRCNPGYEGDGKSCTPRVRGKRLVPLQTNVLM